MTCEPTISMGISRSANVAASSSHCLRYVRSPYPEHKRLAIILDNFNPHLTTKTDTGSVTTPTRTTSNSPTSRSTPAG